MATTLRVASVQVKDVLGIVEGAIEPGKVTIFSGRNGSTKTSYLSAIQAAIGRGNLGKLARIDPDGKEVEPSAVLILAGPGSETYRVERKADKVRVRKRVGESAGFEDVPRPQEFLSSLYDADAANPVRFLSAKDDDERARLLLEALPLTFDRPALLKRMGITESELPPIPKGLHPLEELGLIRDAVFRTRTGVNTSARDKVAAAEETRLNAPAVVPDMPDVAAIERERSDVAAQIAAKETAAKGAETAAMAAVRSAHEQKTQRITDAFKAEAARRRAAHEQTAAAIRAEAERRIADAKAALETEIEGLRERDEDALARADEALAQAQSAARLTLDVAMAEVSKMREQLAKVDADIATMRAQAEAAVSARALHEQADRFDAEATRLKAEAQRLTLALHEADAYARQMAESLPIKGLVIEGKTIKVNGIPYSQLNTAQRVEIAVKVACLRAQLARLPIVFVDGAELLDSEHFELLVDELKKAGTQAFVARVTDEPGLHVATDSTEATA